MYTVVLTKADVIAVLNTVAVTEEHTVLKPFNNETVAVRYAAKKAQALNKEFAIGDVRKANHTSR